MSHALRVISPSEPTTRDRSTYIGGTDCSAIIGKNRWRSPLQVWAEKTGMIEPEDISEKWPVRIGKKLEDDVCEFFTEETGKKVRRVNQTQFHPTYPFLGANIDRMIVGEDAIFEAKTTTWFKSKEWDGEEIPVEYILQCIHYLAVTGKSRCYLAVLIGNQDFRIKVIDRDENTIQALINREVEFWKSYVETRVMPGLITKQDGDTLSQLFPQAIEGKEISLGDQGDQLMEQLESLKADKKNVEGIIDKLENDLKALLADAGRGVGRNYEAHWINSKTSRFDQTRFKVDHPDLFTAYYGSTPTRRFFYKKIKNEERS